MAKYRKLSRTSDQRKALLRSQVTSLLYHGKIVTTEAKAKEIRKIAEGLVAMAVREKDNFETVTVTAKVARTHWELPVPVSSPYPDNISASQNDLLRRVSMRYGHHSE